MADEIIIQRGGIPGPSSDVLQPLVDEAREWAENPEDDEITGFPGHYSALHHAAKAGDAAASATATAGALTGALALVEILSQLPSNVEAIYPCDECSGTTLRDIVNGHTATLTAISGTGTISWSKEGYLVLTGAAFLLPAMSHREIGVILRMPEGDDTSVRMFASSSGEYLGRRSATSSNIAALRCLDGWGITSPRIATSASGSNGVLMALEGGGWQFPVAQFPATRSSTPVIGGDGVTPVQRVPRMEIGGIVVFNATSSDADKRQVLNFMRSRVTKRGIYLMPEDCPVQATNIVQFGESTDDGRFEGLFTGVGSGTTVTIGSALRGIIAEGQEIVVNGVATGRLVLPYGTNGTTGVGGVGTYAVDGAVSFGASTITTSGISTAAMNAVAECLMVNAINSTALQPFRRMSRYSTRPPYMNSSGVTGSTPVTKTGWEIGIRDALMERPHDGRMKHLLKLGIGSTYLLKAGNGTTTQSGVVAKSAFTATISGNIMTVTAISGGAIMPTDYILGAGVTANSQVSAFGTGGTTGTGGTGTYQLSQSSTVASSTAMTGNKLGDIAGSASRSAETLFPYGLNATNHERYLRRNESRARNEGIGYSTFIAVTSDGINDASLGDYVITGVSMYQAMLQAWYDWLKQATGIVNPTWVIFMPHLPYGSTSPTGDLGGPDTDYPNNAMGQSRLNALNFIRTAMLNIAAANPGCIFTIDGTLFDVNNGTDYVHRSYSGNVAAGKAFDALLRRTSFFTASAAGTTLTVTGTPSSPLVVGMEIEETINLTYNPPGNAISSLGTGTGGSGTYGLSSSLTMASIPMNTVPLYRKRTRAAA